jgi:hypothetical protein
LRSPRLSIVIPALGSLDALEATLVSVLQNRPSDCEVVVALDREYDDPYELGEEVRFLTARGATTVADALDAVVRVCRAPVVHVLAAGAEVDDGWTEAALGHFCDDRIAAVAPLVMRSREDVQVCSAGVDYTCGGRRVLYRHGDEHFDETIASDVLGPTSIAAFYRREALLKLPRAFESRVTDRLFDVDLALQLQTAGYRAVFEPRSIAYREAAAAVAAPSAFAAGRGAERLFWRNAPTMGTLKSIALHPFAVLHELFDARPLGAKLAGLAGRALALAEIVSYRRHHRALAALGTPGLAYAVTATGDKIRFDAAHPGTAATSRTTAAADARHDGDSPRAA